MKILIILFLVTSCASKRDWKESHYTNANAAHEAKVLCDSGQKQAALKLGYTCLPRDKHGNILTNSRSVSSSNGNVNNIYFGGQPGYAPQNSGPTFYDAFKSIYETERNERIERIRNFNEN